jgi:hypothetical protein
MNREKIFMAAERDPTVIETTYEVEGYSFIIRDRVSRTREGVIYSRNFQLGGVYPDCVNVSIQYDNTGRPMKAKIPTVMYDPECSQGKPLERKGGTVLMIKTLLQHIHRLLPEITTFHFEDKSTIECGTEAEIRAKRHRKRGTHAVPVPLYYFSIAFNGMTWYEKYLNAIYKDPVSHETYRARVNQFQTEEKLSSFDSFLREAQPPMSFIDELEPLYHASTTYKQFLNAIPMESRCRHARQWLIGWIAEKMKGVFSHTDWMIQMDRMNHGAQGGGKKNKKSIRQQKTRRRRKNTEDPYEAWIRLDGGDRGWDVGE